jgi:hypothetical protein
MTTDSILTAVAAEYADFTLFEEEQPEQVDPFVSYCPDAKAYWRYADEVLNQYVRETNDLTRLLQGEVLITDRYLDFRAYAAKGHRDKIGDKGHICLYQVWITSMHEIRSKRLALDPPKVIKVVTPKPKPESDNTPYAVLPPAVFLGEWKG